MNANQDPAEATNPVVGHYDQSAAEYDSVHGGTNDPEHLRALELAWPMIKPRGVSSLLDVGCGTGRSLAWFAARDPGLRLSGVDPSARMLDFARKRLPQADFRTTGGENLPFEDNSFDLVVATGILHHVASPRAAGRVNKPPSNVWVEAYCDLVRKWRPMAWAEETGQIRAGVGPYLIKRTRERQAFCVREQFPTRHDKAVRAQSIRGRMAAMGLRIHRDAAWRTDRIAELLRFPVGVHDDQADALGLIGQLLDKMLAPAKEKREAKPRRDMWDEPDPSGPSWQTV